LHNALQQLVQPSTVSASQSTTQMPRPVRTQQETTQTSSRQQAPANVAHSAQAQSIPSRPPATPKRQAAPESPVRAPKVSSPVVSQPTPVEKPLPATAAAALELEKLATLVEEVMHKKEIGEYNKTQVEGHLMKVLLSLDQLPISPLLRPVRKSLAAEVNRILDSLSSAPQDVAQEPEPAPSEDSSTVAVSEASPEPLAREEHHEEEVSVDLVELQEEEEEESERQEEDDFVLVADEGEAISPSEDAHLSSEPEPVVSTQEEIPAENAEAQVQPEEEENLTLELTQALLAARQESDDSDVTPGGPDDTVQSSSAPAEDANEQDEASNQKEQENTHEDGDLASDSACLSSEDNVAEECAPDDLGGVIIEDVSEEEEANVQQAVALPCA